MQDSFINNISIIVQEKKTHSFQPVQSQQYQREGDNQPIVCFLVCWLTVFKISYYPQLQGSLLP